VIYPYLELSGCSQKSIFSTANLKTFVKLYNERAAQKGIAQTPEFTASFLTHI
jgi:hypothetical protein